MSTRLFIDPCDERVYHIGKFPEPPKGAHYVPPRFQEFSGQVYVTRPDDDLSSGLGGGGSSSSSSSSAEGGGAEEDGDGGTKKKLNSRNAKKQREKQRKVRTKETEEAPWIMMDSQGPDGPNTFTGKEARHGSGLGGARRPGGGNHVLMMMEKDEEGNDRMRIAPVDKWYTFAQKAKFKAMTIDEAEGFMVREGSYGRERGCKRLYGVVGGCAGRVGG